MQDGFCACAHLHYWSKIVVHDYDVSCLLRHLHQSTHKHIHHCDVLLRHLHESLFQHAHEARRTHFLVLFFVIKTWVCGKRAPVHISFTHLSVLWTSRGLHTHTHTHMGLETVPGFLSSPWQTPRLHASKQAHRWCHLLWLLLFEEWALAIVESLNRQQHKISAPLRNSNQKYTWTCAECLDIPVCCIFYTLI